MQLYKNKKSLEIISIIYLALAVISLIIILMFVNNFLKSSSYGSSVIGCEQTFDQIAGKSTFFKNGDKINLNFKRIVSLNCPYKLDEDSNIRAVVDEVYSCYKKADYGKNVFTAAAFNEKVCLYCGEFIFKEDIDNFNTKFIKEIKKRRDYKSLLNSETFNMNKYLLFDKKFLPEKVKKGEVVNVVYYTTFNAGKVGGKVIRNPFWDMINSVVNKWVNFFYKPDLSRIYVGVGLSVEKNNMGENSDFSQKKEFKFGKTLLFNCGENLIIPKDYLR